MPVSRTVAAGAGSASSEGTDHCYTSGFLASVLAVPEEAVMTHFDSVTEFEPASDCCLMTSVLEVTRATNVAFTSDSGTVRFGCWLCLQRPVEAGSSRRLAGRPGQYSAAPATV